MGMAGPCPNCQNLKNKYLRLLRNRGELEETSRKGCRACTLICDVFQFAIESSEGALTDECIAICRDAADSDIFFDINVQGYRARVVLSLNNAAGKHYLAQPSNSSLTRNRYESMELDGPSLTSLCWHSAGHLCHADQKMVASLSQRPRLVQFASLNTTGSSHRRGQFESSALVPSRIQLSARRVHQPLVLLGNIAIFHGDDFQYHRV